MWPRLVMRSADQTHYFNCPYQVSAEDFEHVSQRVDELSAVARDGDILVAATDGVLDNLFDTQIQLIVARSLRSLHDSEPAAVQAAVDDLAEAIAKQASAVGLREDEEGLHTPFQAAAAQEGYRFLGGKLDDIAVVCGIVRQGERPTPRNLDNFGA